MAEEHRCQAPPEGPRLCANNCGFRGSPATLGLCSNCYFDRQLKEEQEASAKMAVEKSLLTSPASATPTASEAVAEQPASASGHPAAAAAAAVPLPPLKDEPSPTGPSTPAAPSLAGDAASAAVQPGRCTSCRKRVGLTGFRCRCGLTFCGSHRYPEKHGCTFDFKSVGREALARANPVVKADKLNGRI